MARMHKQFAKITQNTRGAQCFRSTHCISLKLINNIELLIHFSQKTLGGGCTAATATSEEASTSIRFRVVVATEQPSDKLVANKCRLYRRCLRRCRLYRSTSLLAFPVYQLTDRRSGRSRGSGEFAAPCVHPIDGL